MLTGERQLKESWPKRRELYPHLLHPHAIVLGKSKVRDFSFILKGA